MPKNQARQEELYTNIVTRVPPPKDLPNTITTKTKTHTLNEAQYGRLEEATSYFLSIAPMFDRLPRASKLRATMKNLISSGDSFLKAIANIDDLSHSLLLNENLGRVGEVNTGTLRKTRELVERIVETSRDVQKHIPQDRGGRPAEFAQLVYILELAAIYKEVTGECPSVAYSPYYEEGYSSPFLEFVRLCLTKCNRQFQSSEALGKAIYRALKKTPCTQSNQP